jgi:hypothetical protein
MPMCFNLTELASIGTILSGLAAIIGIPLLYFTYRAQSKELKITQQALIDQKGEMTNQNITLSKQLFENTFAHNLDLLFDKFDAVECSHVSGGGKVIGRPSFHYFYEQHLLVTVVATKKRELVLTKLKNSNRHATQENVDGEMNHLFYPITTFNGDFAFHNCDFKIYLSNCIRSLYQLVKSIHDSETITEKRKYIRTIIDQLTDYELVLLFYVVQFDFREDEFKPIIEEYNLFSNLKTQLLFDKEHKHGYDVSAYKKSLK